MNFKLKSGEIVTCLVGCFFGILVGFVIMTIGNILTVTPFSSSSGMNEDKGADDLPIILFISSLVAAFVAARFTYKNTKNLAAVWLGALILAFISALFVLSISNSYGMVLIMIGAIVVVTWVGAEIVKSNIKARSKPESPN